MDDTNSLIEQRKARLAALGVLLLAVACLAATNQTSMAVKPAAGETPAAIKVTGVQWQFETEDALRFMGSGVRHGYTLYLKAELTNSIFYVNRVEFSRAMTMEGMNLLPQKRGWNEAPNPQLLPGGSQVTFRACLVSPPLDSKGIAELSGFLECSSPEEWRTVELISGKLRGGTKGTEFGTQIDDKFPNLAGGDKLALRTSLKPEQLRSVKVVGDDGQSASLSRRTHTIFGDEHVYTYACRQELPLTGKIVADVMTGNQMLKVPFTLTNLTLLGQPLLK